MAQLLVSVRSETEARAALDGGATIIDIKEPSRGSLGMAPCATWQGVRKVVPPSVVVSVALGELAEWTGNPCSAVSRHDWEGIGFRKIGLANAGSEWRARWRGLRATWDDGDADMRDQPQPAWVAVVYLDWEAANAPDPHSVISEAASIARCRGVLLDTWDKTRTARRENEVDGWIRRAKEAGKFVALAGSLDEAGIRRLRHLEPDIFAVRGAACRGGDRNSAIDPGRVARLVRAAGVAG